MPDIDVLKCVKEWYSSEYDTTDGRRRSNITDGRRRSVSDPNCNLRMIKLKVRGNTKWTPIYDLSPDGNVTRVVDITGVTGASGGLEPFGHIYASNESETFCTVTITNGVITGLNRMIKLDLEGTGLVNQLGSFIEIDPSLDESDIKREKVRVTVAVEKSIASETATASVTCRNREYRAHFECDVVMTGNVAISEGPRAALTHKISEIFKDLRPKMPELTFKQRKCVHKLEGEVHFRWEHEENVKLM